MKILLSALMSAGWFRSALDERSAPGETGAPGDSVGCAAGAGGAGWALGWAGAALLLAAEPADKINGRVTYSQQILGEYGQLDQPTGRGVTTKGSGYSQI